MTTFVFENMTADEAANFTNNDTLVFSTASLLPSDVVVSSSNNGLDLTSVTAAGKTLVFSGEELYLASIDGDIRFTSSFIAGHDTSLYVGSFGGEFVGVTNNDDGDILYGFYGNDNIVGANGADIIYGGGGADNISGGSGNDHIYGFQLSGGTAADDGADTIHAGAGNDYVQGNAGNDVLFGEDGNDRINGGNNDDNISGGNGNDTVNGNLGNDTIDGGDGNDSLRGGQGNDVITGGIGNDIILGDVGNDVLTGGVGYDILTGGAGADTFVFGAADSTFVTTGTLAFFADTITDFTDGTDHINLPAGVGATAADVLHAQTGIVLTSVAAALTYAQQLLDAHAGTTDVAALNVGSDAYLFYASSTTGATIDSLIKLTGVDAANITVADLT